MKEARVRALASKTNKQIQHMGIPHKSGDRNYTTVANITKPILLTQITGIQSVGNGLNYVVTQWSTC